LAVTAPPPAPLPSWTGFYVGVHAGAAWQSTPGWSFVDPNLFLITINPPGNSALGGVGGLQAGYNWQFAPAWVVGVEGDFSWTSLADHRTVAPISSIFAPIIGPGNSTSSLSMSANTEWLASVRGKLGFTGWLNNTMFYGTGGVAWAQMEYSAQAVVIPPPGIGAGAQISNTSFQTTKSGWVAGGGAEWMATPNILLRAEYLFYGLNTSATASAGVFPPFAVTPQALNYNWAKDNVQVFRIAGSYKF
jgi:outer membrane immunogenic protein